ncbi:hypothetical protein [Salinigranum sp.]|uniref:hypothetical protein n=1 Tax=Salinigranum sp. TaxID=1966351 RepID=UPI003563E76B
MTTLTETAGGEAAVPRHATGAPDRFEIVRGLAFAVSALAVALFALQTSDTVSVPVTYLLVPLVAYPMVQLVAREYRRSLLDLVYLVVLFGGLGGVLVFSSSHPLGFIDVFLHLRAAEETVVDGRLALAGDYVSTSFVGLYLVTAALTSLGDLPTTTVARALPLVTLVTTVAVFYHVFVSHFLTQREALLATVIFGINWGVFRFSIEYRTLNVAFLVVLLLLGLFVRGVEVTRRSRETLGLYTLLTVGLVLAHFATTLMYLLFLAVLTATFAVDRRSTRPFAYLLITALVLFVYVGYVSGSLTGFLTTVGRELVGLFAVSAVGTSGGGGSGVAGVTYGRRMFFAEWTVRLLFVASFGVFTLLWLRTRAYIATFVVTAAFVLGGLVVTAVVTGFLLNPGRVLTFFAIPYAVAFAVGLLAVHRIAEPEGTGRVARIRRALRGPTARDATRVVVSVALVLVLLTSVMKFPVDIVGTPEPVRVASPVDEEPHLHIDAQEVDARTFLHRYVSAGDEDIYLYGDQGYNRIMDAFYGYGRPTPETSVTIRDRYACDCGFAVVGQTDPGHDRPVEATHPGGSRVYDNGVVEVFELDRWSEDANRWQRQLQAEGRT